MAEPTVSCVMLTARQRELLLNMIETERSGIEEARQATNDDRSLRKAEDLLVLHSGYDETLEDLTAIERQLA